MSLQEEYSSLQNSPYGVMLCTNHWKFQVLARAWKNYRKTIWDHNLNPSKRTSVISNLRTPSSWCRWPVSIELLNSNQILGKVQKLRSNQHMIRRFSYRDHREKEWLEKRCSTCIQVSSIWCSGEVSGDEIAGGNG